MDIHEILATKKPVELPVTIWLDPTAAGVVQRAEADLAAARAAGHDTTGPQERLDSARKTAAASAVTFRMRAIGGQAYEALKAHHTPTPAQTKAHHDLLAARGVPRNRHPLLVVNPDTWPPALVAVSCVQPDMSLEDAEALWESERFNDDELARLYAAAEAVNTSSPAASLPEG